MIVKVSIKNVLQTLIFYLSIPSLILIGILIKTSAKWLFLSMLYFFFAILIFFTNTDNKFNFERLFIVLFIIFFVIWIYKKIIGSNKVSPKI